MPIQNPAELMAHRERTITNLAVSRQEHFLPRLTRFLKIAVTHGPLYATALTRMTSTAEYDPEHNWAFWTENKLLESILRGYPGRRRRRELVERMLQQGHAKGIEFHYDVSNDFYSLFLDKDYMFYTCARFLSEDDTLEQAQKNKADFLLELLAPEAGHQILDLGFGWGGMMGRIAEETGTRDGLRGYTLSKQQMAYVTDLGYDVELRDFIENDYAPESLDRVISVGSLEHVRPDEIPNFYSKIFRALRPGGRMVNQFFSLDHEPFPYSMVLSQLFFPSSVLAMHSVHLQAAEKAGFVMKEDVTDSYKKTLRAWYDNLVSNRDKAIATSGINIYNEYLTFFPIAWRFFDRGESTLHRMLLLKQ
jgi:cyclopropane-fatty-acyl-phospholipid synthase